VRRDHVEQHADRQRDQQHDEERDRHQQAAHRLPVEPLAEEATHPRHPPELGGAVELEVVAG
jgi:hypothetical protein